MIRLRSVRALTSAALLSSGLGMVAMAGGGAAHADPSYTAAARPYICVGADGDQDLFNAFTGAEPSPGPEPSGDPYLATQYYPVMHTASGSTAKNPNSQLVSFDAVDPHLAAPSNNTETITPILNGVTFDRPNGATDGRAALEAAITGGTFARAAQPGTPEPTSGEVDCARSTSASGTASTTVSSASNQMSGIPFASDADGYAYHCGTAADCTALAQLPAAVFQTLYGAAAAGSGSGLINPGTNGWSGSAPLAACSAQSSSGIFKAFLQSVARITGGSAIAPATAQSNLQQSGGSNCTGVEINNLSSFLADGPGGSLSGASTDDWIIPASIGSLYGQHAGLALNRSGQSGNVFFSTGGGYGTGNGIGGVTDAWSTKLQGSASAGSTSISVALKPSVGESLTIDPGVAGTAETVTVQSVGAISGSTYPVTLTTGLANTHSSGAAVQDLSVGEGLAADLTGSTWTIDNAYEGSQLGSWLFVYVNSASITAGFTKNQGIDDLFFSPLATSGTAAICSAPYSTEAGQFGFDTALPDNGTSGEQSGSCGHVAFTGATS
jgi:hypothetical protein